MCTWKIVVIQQLTSVAVTISSEWRPTAHIRIRDLSGRVAITSHQRTHILFGLWGYSGNCHAQGACRIRETRMVNMRTAIKQLFNYKTIVVDGQCVIIENLWSFNK